MSGLGSPGEGTHRALRDGWILVISCFASRPGAISSGFLSQYSDFLTLETWKEFLRSLNSVNLRVSLKGISLSQNYRY